MEFLCYSNPAAVEDTGYNTKKYKVGLRKTEIDANVNVKVRTNRTNRANRTNSVNSITYKVFQCKYFTVY